MAQVDFNCAFVKKIAISFVYFFRSESQASKPRISCIKDRIKKSKQTISKKWLTKLDFVTILIWRLRGICYNFRIGFNCA